MLLVGRVMSIEPAKQGLILSGFAEPDVYLLVAIFLIELLFLSDSYFGG